MTISHNDSPLFFRLLFGGWPQKTFMSFNGISQFSRWVYCSKDHNIPGFQGRYRRKNARDGKHISFGSCKLHKSVFQEGKTLLRWFLGDCTTLKREIIFVI